MEERKTLSPWSISKEYPERAAYFAKAEQATPYPFCSCRCLQPGLQGFVPSEALCSASLVSRKGGACNLSRKDLVSRLSGLSRLVRRPADQRGCMRHFGDYVGSGQASQIPSQAPSRLTHLVLTRCEPSNFEVRMSATSFQKF